MFLLDSLVFFTEKNIQGRSGSRMKVSRFLIEVSVGSSRLGSIDFSISISLIESTSSLSRETLSLACFVELAEY